MKSYSRVNVNDYELSRVQDAVENALAPILKIELLDGVLLENISLISGQDNLIEHKLGRNFRLWSVMRLNAQSIIYEGTQSLQNKFINLQCSTSCTITLWVA